MAVESKVRHLLSAFPIPVAGETDNLPNGSFFVCVPACLLKFSSAFCNPLLFLFSLDPLGASISGGLLEVLPT